MKRNDPENTEKISSHHAIHYYLPNPHRTEVDRISVKAPPAVAWEAARHFDMASIPWVRFLFDLRTLPERLLGRIPQDADRRLGVDQVVAGGTGFMMLEERPGEEVVVGAIGQFWHLNIPFADVSPEDFRNFAEPGWGKLAWAIIVEPQNGGSGISVELRITATDEASWRRFRRYFRLIGPWSRLIRRSVLKRLERSL